MKRIVMDRIYELGTVKKQIKSKFFKVFVMLSKNSIPFLQNQIENQSKKDIKDFVIREFDKSWQMFIEKIK